MRKFTASLLIAFTLWGSFIAPAKAVFPIIGAVYLASVDTLGATLTHTLIASAGLHAGIAAIEIMSDSSQPAANGSNTAIQIQLDPYIPLTNPESAAVPPPTVAPVNQETVVSTTQVHYKHQDAYCNGLSISPAYEGSFGAVRDLWKNRVVGDNSCQCGSRGRTVSITNENPPAFSYEVKCADDGYSYGVSNGNFQTINSCEPGATWNGSACVKMVESCPSGYTMNEPENLCYSNSPTQQQADAKTQIERILDNFQKNPNDPDPIPENLLVRPKDIVISTPERTTKVHINDDGTSTVTEISTTSDGNTKVDKLNISAPGPGSAPTVIGKESQVIPGQESGPADPDATVNSPVPPGTSSGSPKPAAGSTTVLNLPDNLAKTEDVTQVRDKLTTTNEKLTDINKSMRTDIDSSVNGDKASVDGNVAQLGTSADGFETNSQGTLSSMTSNPLDQHGITWDWLPELPTAECSTFQYGAGTHVFTWDFCPVVAKIRDILGYAIYIGTAIALLYIALGRKAE